MQAEKENEDSAHEISFAETQSFVVADPEEEKHEPHFLFMFIDGWLGRNRFRLIFMNSLDLDIRHERIHSVKA